MSGKNDISDECEIVYCFVLALSMMKDDDTIHNVIVMQPIKCALLGVIDKFLIRKSFPLCNASISFSLLSYFIVLWYFKFSGTFRENAKGVGLVKYYLIKLKGKLILGLQGNQSFLHVTLRNYQFICTICDLLEALSSFPYGG